MALEIAASRLLAQRLGVSLYSWTGIIGVVLAGIAFGNYAGGLIADHFPRRETLGHCLFFASLFTVLVIILFAVLSHPEKVEKYGAVGEQVAWVVNGIEDLRLISRIVAWTAVLFLAPMYLLGTVSPQVIRLAVSDYAHAGRVAGRVYAWSCAGAIAGTFATGWGLIALLGVLKLICSLSLVLMALSAVVDRPWRRPAELFVSSMVVGAAVVAVIFGNQLITPPTMETNYYTIQVDDSEYQGEPVKRLTLDHLIHSYVKPDDPTFTGYEHEQVQVDVARLVAEQTGGTANVLVIGGGGYTFPRWAEVKFPGMKVEVVEIDPGVTEVAHRELGLRRDTKIITHNMDGRQFVQEQAPRGHYQLVVQDAVNDLSVPYHIMTKEYNDAVARLLTPDGIYLLTVIDEYEDGLLMRAAVRTMRATFPHVTLLAAGELWKSDEDDEVGRQVWVIYGSSRPYDATALAQALNKQGTGVPTTAAMPDDVLEAYLDRRPAPVLTDAYAPVENLISVVFRKR